MITRKKHVNRMTQNGQRGPRGLIKVFAQICCLVICMLPFVTSANDFPSGWEGMEIEAKWDVAEPVFNTIVTAFPDAGTKYGYDLNVRWSGQPRRYVDYYYDTPGGDLFNGLHALRFRQRFRTSSSVSILDSTATLQSTTWDTLNWNKVQYKSTPSRIAAVWFRTERGNMQLTPSQVIDTLSGSAPHSDSDDPVALLINDHPGLDFSTLIEVLEVVQFRYRVKFLDPSTSEALFELSLDKIVTTEPGGTPVNSYSVELEVLPNGPHNQDRVETLLTLMQTIEEEFAVERAITSKGGVPVHDSALPIMRLKEAFINYRDVELGFEFSKAITIYNDGYAPLVVSVSNNHAGSPDLDQWSDVNEKVDEIVAPGAVPLLVVQTYAPNELDTHTIQFEVTGNDPNNAMQTVVLEGTGIGTKPIDSVLVLDRSGSMSEVAGERQKIEAMRDAADLFANLLRKDTGTGDGIGLVKYNHESQVYLGLAPVDDPGIPGSHMDMLLNEKISDDALTDSDRLLPLDSTGIGGAMETAAGMLVGRPAERKHVMVVLTDGIENEEPYIEDVIGPIQSADPSLTMYSVGVGDNIEPDKLQQITNVGNGYHQVVGDLSGASFFDLETFYFKIFANAVGMDLVVDPTVAVSIVGAKPIVVDTVRITASDRKAVFLALDNPALRKYYTLELVAPNGQVIEAGTSVGGISIHYAQRRTYTVYKVILPDNSITSEYLGDWLLRLTPRGQLKPDTIAETDINQGSVVNRLKTGVVPVGFAAAVASNFRMHVSALPAVYRSGTAMTLAATLTDKGWPAVSGQVWVDVTLPNGEKLETIKLHDDGTKGDAVTNDGTWSTTFTNTLASGSYRIIFRALGRNTEGELVPREAARYVTLMQPRPQKPESQQCLPCYLQWLVIIILLIIILWLMWTSIRLWRMS